MAQIFIQKDPQINHSDIVMSLTNSSKDEIGKANYDKFKNQEGIQQTALIGVATPLIEINNIVVNFNNIIDFELNCTYNLPTVHMVVIDGDRLITYLDDTGNDNELRIEILPDFENAYKKINLTFFITSISITNSIITLSGQYKLPQLTSCNIKSFGELSIFDFFKQISAETGLGFASNIESNDCDKHYIYCDNKSYLDIMNREIKYSGSEKQIFDYWIDFWNNLNYADIYERYNTIDNDEDLMIWTVGKSDLCTEGAEGTPYKTAAYITNNPLAKNTDLYVSNFNIVNNSGSSMSNGTDKVYSIYEKNKGEYNDFLIQDSDIKRDIFTKYEYLGETYSDFNYLLMNKCRDAYLQKINSEVIEVTINAPVISLMRGHKVNYINYITDDKLEGRLKAMEENNLLDKDSQPNIDINFKIDPKYEANGKLRIDKKLTGQYLIIGTSIKYKKDHWETILSLVKPASQKSRQMKLE